MLAVSEPSPYQWKLNSQQTTLHLTPGTATTLSHSGQSSPMATDVNTPSGGLATHTNTLTLNLSHRCQTHTSHSATGVTRLGTLWGVCKRNMKYPNIPWLLCGLLSFSAEPIAVTVIVLHSIWYTQHHAHCEMQGIGRKGLMNGRPHKVKTTLSHVTNMLRNPATVSSWYGRACLGAGSL